MRIPPEVVIKSTIRPGSVFYFVEPSFTSKEPHCFVVVNNNPHSDRILIMVCATSKVDKRKLYVSLNRLPFETLVEVNPSECSFLTMPTVFDCNHPKKDSIENLISRYEKGELRLKDYIPSSILKRLQYGVIKSPLVDPATKKIIQP